MINGSSLYTYKAPKFSVNQDAMNNITQYNWQALIYQGSNDYDPDFDDPEDANQNQELHEDIPKSLFKKQAMNDENYFLFYFFTLLPDKDEARYEIIKCYTDKNHNYGLEYKVAIQFEIQARVKENVYAIEDAVAYYKDNFLKDGIFKYDSFHNFDNSKIGINTNATPLVSEEPYKNYLKHIEYLTKLIKKLVLVPYQIYTEHNKFEHWSINPFIYEIVNFVYYYDNTVRASQYKIISHDEKNKITTFQITSEFENVHQYHRAMLMKNNMKLEQNIALNYESALGEKELTELEVDILQLDVKRDTISNTVRYSYYYPKIKEYSTLNIAVDLSTDSKQIKAYLNAIIDNLDEVVSSNILPPLFDIPIEENSRLSVADAFFAYDYYTYRVEQISHQKKYALYSQDEDHKADEEEYSKTTKDTKMQIYQEILGTRDNTQTQEFTEKEEKNRTKAIEKEISKINDLVTSAKNNQKII